MNEDSFKNKLEQLSIRTEVARQEDWEIYKDIRIEALTKNPEAFGSTLEKALAKTPEEWQADLTSSHRFFVLAKIDSAITGSKSMAGAFKRENNETWQIVGVYTRVEFRGYGLAEQVIKEVLEEIKKRGGIKATLNVTEKEEQEPARKLYIKLGFKEKEKEKDAGEFSLVMEKDLIGS